LGIKFTRKSGLIEDPKVLLIKKTGLLFSPRFLCSTLAKTNKNHYPDSDWVWQQIENSTTGRALGEALDKKYALKAHGNEGNPGNRWKNKNK